MTRASYRAILITYLVRTNPLAAKTVGTEVRHDRQIPWRSGWTGPDGWNIVKERGEEYKRVRLLLGFTWWL
jgi:hypothetical protein